MIRPSVQHFHSPSLSDLLVSPWSVEHRLLLFPDVPVARLHAHESNFAACANYEFSVHGQIARLRLELVRVEPQLDSLRQLLDKRLELTRVDGASGDVNPADVHHLEEK